MGDVLCFRWKSMTKPEESAREHMSVLSCRPISFRKRQMPSDKDVQYKFFTTEDADDF